MSTYDQRVEARTARPPLRLSFRLTRLHLDSPTARVALGFAALLVFYNNIAYSWHPLAFPPPWLLFPRAVLLPAIAVAWAVSICGLRFDDLGLARARFGNGARVGLGLAVLAAAPIALYLAFPIGFGRDAFSFDNINGVAADPLYALYWALLLYPLHTVIFEEVLFRGVLQGLAVRAFKLGPGLLLTAAAFALWHLVVDFQVLREAQISQQPVLFVLLQVVVLAAIFAGGLVLGWLRERSGSVLAPIAFHGGFLGILAGTLFLLAQ